ncbi:MAG: hypothetical protein NWE89_13500 [Candidatus Bathyarchaeota archaeon]|nr:hypothetical protein [Candidatus Bathyarchaeota archaeon]
MNPRILAFVVLILALSVAPVSGLGEHDVLLKRAFNAVAMAEDAGGDVASLLVDINMALEFIRAGGVENIAEAERILEAVILEAGKARDAGVRHGNIAAAKAILVVSVLVALSALTWRYGSRVFWKAWLVTKRGWVVEN